MDNDVLAYRVLLEKRKENAPFWEKKVLTVEEAAEYTGIGRTKIRQIIMRGDCPFAVTNGVQVCVIRDKFIDYAHQIGNREGEDRHSALNRVVDDVHFPLLHIHAKIPPQCFGSN